MTRDGHLATSGETDQSSDPRPTIRADPSPLSMPSTGDQKGTRTMQTMHLMTCDEAV